MNDSNTAFQRFFRASVLMVGAAVVLVLGGAVWFRFQAGRAPERAKVWFRERNLPVTAPELDRWHATPAPGSNAATVVERVAFRVSASAKDLEVLNQAKPERLPPRGTAWPKKLAGDIGRALADLNPLWNELGVVDGMAGSRFPLEILKGYNMHLPHLAPIKDLARVLGIRAQHGAEVSDPSEAVQNLEHMFRVAQSLESEPTLISHLVRIAVVSLERDAAERVLNRVALTEDHLLALSTRSARADTNLLGRALIGEMCLGSMAFSLSTADLAKFGADLAQAGNDEPAAPQVSAMKYFLWAYSSLGLKHLDYAFFLEFHRSMQEAFMLPSHEVQARLNEIEANLQKRIRTHPKSTIISRALLPAILKAHNRAFQSMAMLRVQGAALAVERYRLANGGALPKRLETLVPKYLTEVPKDPFNGEPIRYRLKGTGYVVYSVGSDGSDDGGLERDPRVKRGESVSDITFTVERK